MNKNMIIVIHGSKEYKDRYINFLNFLEQNNNDTYFYSLPAHDVNFNGKYYVKDFDYVFDELNKLVNDFKIKYENVIIFGHSLGSLVTMNYEIIYPNTVNKIILSGATYPRNKLKFFGGNILINSLIKIKGADYESTLVEDIIFQGFANKMKKKHKTDDWLSYDYESNLEFSKSIYRSKIFTLGFNKQLVQMTMNLQNSKFNTRTLLITGKKDPVSDFTKCIDELEKHFTNYKRIDYEESRHEILNDCEKEQVFDDILNFINE